MRLCKIISEPSHGLVFIADRDDVIRLPLGGFEAVAVLFTNNLRPSPVVLTVWDGQWRFGCAPSDPAGTLAALLALAKQKWPQREIGISENGSHRIRVFEGKLGTFDRSKWTLAGRWDDWNRRGLRWKARQTEMGKLGFREFENTNEKTFRSTCTRPPLSLKYCPKSHA
jgi:hypothetical protein